MDLFVYDERWRVINTYRLADWSYSVSNPSAANSKERFVYHAAGLGGWGGSSYIDAVILRDRDMNTAWTAASDGTLEKRHYYCQNWRADVSAIIDSSGKMVEWVKYSAYGVPFSLPSGDTDSDLDWDATDSAAMTGSYDVRKDADLDGDVDAADATHANSIKPGTGYQTLGRGVQSSTGVDNRKSYAGYEYDPTFKGAGRVLMHVRHRVYDAELGRWGRRDPLRNVRGNSTFGFCMQNPLVRNDISGLACQRNNACGGQPWPPRPPIWQPPNIIPPIYPGIYYTCEGTRKNLPDLLPGYNQSCIDLANRILLACCDFAKDPTNDPAIVLACISDALSAAYDCQHPDPPPIIPPAIVPVPPPATQPPEDGTPEYEDPDYWLRYICYVTDSECGCDEDQNASDMISCLLLANCLLGDDYMTLYGAVGQCCAKDTQLERILCLWGIYLKSIGFNAEG